MNLTDQHPLVPRATRPVYWRRDMAMQYNLDRIELWVGHYGEKLPDNAFIDEAAIMVPNQWHRAKVTKQLVEAGWELFNEATDVVFTNPFGTRYCVAYLFFRHPDHTYRIELMMPAEDETGEMGFSPLHQALAGAPATEATVAYPIPHLSFKYPGDYGRRAYGLAVQALKDKACIPAMTCQSTYGVFGYFIGNDTYRQIYLKPRVNLRDEEQ